MLNSRPYCGPKIWRSQVLKANSRSDCSLVRILSHAALRIHADLPDLNKLAAAGDTARIERLRNLVNGSDDAHPNHTYSNSTPPASSSPHRPPSLPQQNPPPSFGMPPNPPFAGGNSSHLRHSLLLLMTFREHTLQTEPFLLYRTIFNWCTGMQRFASLISQKKGSS